MKADVWKKSRTLFPSNYNIWQPLQSQKLHLCFQWETGGILVSSTLHRTQGCRDVFSWSFVWPSFLKLCITVWHGDESESTVRAPWVQRAPPEWCRLRRRLQEKRRRTRRPAARTGSSSPEPWSDTKPAKEEDETIVTFIKASGICSSLCRGLLCENSIKKSWVEWQRRADDHHTAVSSGPEAQRGRRSPSRCH